MKLAIMKKKSKNRRRSGLKIEKLAAEILNKKGYLVWRPPKIMFHSQDILGLFDIIALSKRELKLIQVQKDRKRPYKNKKIFKLPKPKSISFELWIYKSKEKKFYILKEI